MIPRGAWVLKITRDIHRIVLACNGYIPMENSEVVPLNWPQVIHSVFRKEDKSAEVTYEESKTSLNRALTQAGIIPNGRIPHKLRIVGATAYASSP